MAGKTKEQAAPVTVDNHAVRTDDDALEGHFCKVVAGDDEGVVGVFESVVDRESDGYPKHIIVRSRDASNRLFTVAYKDVRPAVGYNGGR